MFEGRSELPLDYMAIEDIKFEDQAEIPTSSDYFIFNDGQRDDIAKIDPDLVNNYIISVVSTATVQDDEYPYMRFSRPPIQEIAEKAKENQSLFRKIVYNMNQQLFQGSLGNDLALIGMYLDRNRRDTAESKFAILKARLKQLKIQIDATTNFLELVGGGSGVDKEALKSLEETLEKITKIKDLVDETTSVDDVGGKLVNEIKEIENK
ncbi:MAG TPA: hypothetical protein VF209_00180 [Patescibacteria group bacterium]